MMPTFRQQPIKRRTLWGAVTLFCLLWHILLPTMVHVGLLPALFVMPAHCQPAGVSSGYSGAGPDNIEGQPVMPDHSIANDLRPHQIQLPASTTQGSIVTSASDAFHTQHAHEVFALATQIMKHCPLCSHGLDSGVLIPLIALFFILLAQWFAVIRSLGYQQLKRLFIPQISFALPFKHGPPVIL